MAFTHQTFAEQFPSDFAQVLVMCSGEHFEDCIDITRQANLYRLEGFTHSLKPIEREKRKGCAAQTATPQNVTAKGGGSRTVKKVEAAEAAFALPVKWTMPRAAGFE